MLLRLHPPDGSPPARSGLTRATSPPLRTCCATPSARCSWSATAPAYIRRRGAKKRHAAASPVTLDDSIAAVDDQAELIVAIDEALSRLAELDPRQARVVEMRFFAGLTEDETAELLGVSARTVRNDWVKAKGWLFRELREEPGD